MVLSLREVMAISLMSLYGEIDISPVLAVVAVAVIVYLVTFVIVTAGVVHEHDVVADQVFVTVLLQERKRGVGWRRYRFALGVVFRPGKFGGGTPRFKTSMR